MKFQQAQCSSMINVQIPPRATVNMQIRFWGILQGYDTFKFMEIEREVKREFKVHLDDDGDSNSLKCITMCSHESLVIL